MLKFMVRNSADNPEPSKSEPPGDLVPSDLNETLSGLCAIARTLLRISDGVAAVLLDAEAARGLRLETTPIPPQVAQVLLPMGQAVGISTNSVLQLSQHVGLQAQDCFSITRSLVELTVNMCYIMAEGTSAAEAAIRHAQQKSFRDLTRTSTVGASTIGLMADGLPDPAEIPNLEIALKEFTSRGGRERDWTDFSIDDRIARAGAVLGSRVLTALHFARFIVYRHSSEVLHGSFFGAIWFLGLTDPKGVRVPRDIAAHVGGLHCLALHAVVLALFADLIAFHEAFGFEWARSQAEEAIKGLGRLAWLENK